MVWLDDQFLVTGKAELLQLLKQNKFLKLCTWFIQACAIMQTRKSVIGTVFAHANQKLVLIAGTKTPIHKDLPRDNELRLLRYALISLHRVTFLCVHKNAKVNSSK